MTIVLIQPHPDDLAYSIGGCIIKKMFGKDPLAITIFNRSKSTKKEVDDISTIRQKEDKEYFRKIGIRYISLDFPDSSIRPFEYTIDTLDRIKTELYKINPQCSDIFAPLAIGHHIDHLLVREAVKDFKSVTYYEDVPYVFRYSPQLQKSMTGYTFDISDVLIQKIKNIEIYESQIDEPAINQVKQRTYERFWHE